MRDWKKNPPETREDGFQCVEYLAREAIKTAIEMYGDAITFAGLPTIRRTDHSVIVEWPDGKEPSEIEIWSVQ